MMCLLRNAQVTQINPQYTLFDDADAIRIAEALRCDHPARAWLFCCAAKILCSKIVHRNSDVRISHVSYLLEGTCCVVFGFAGRFVRRNTTLQHLTLKSNKISDAGAAAFAEGLRCVHGEQRCVFFFCTSAFRAKLNANLIVSVYECFPMAIVLSQT